MFLPISPNKKYIKTPTKNSFKHPHLNNLLLFYVKIEKHTLLVSSFTVNEITIIITIKQTHFSKMRFS